MGKRHKGRILAFQALYAWDMAKDKAAGLIEDLLSFSWQEEKPLKDMDFPRLLVAGTVENIITIDETIKKHLERWDFSRLTMVDRALLRLSVYELLFINTTPASVVIDEAVLISREYGTDDSWRFVNGVLDGVRKTIQPGLQTSTQKGGKEKP
jgi:N utilization substance protein B